MTTSPDAAGEPPGGEELLAAMMQILDDWQDVWVVFVVNILNGSRWGFYRANDGVPSNRYSHDMKNPSAQIALSVALADAMIEWDVSNETYSLFASDPTLKHSVGYSRAHYEYHENSSSSE
jgi:hypothetical protein